MGKGSVRPSIETGPASGVEGGVRGLLGEKGANKLSSVAVDEATAEASPIHGEAPEATAEDKVVDVTPVGAVGAMVTAMVASLSEAPAAGVEPNPIVAATQSAGMSPMPAPMPWRDLDDARDDACSGGVSDGVMGVAAATAVKAAASGEAGRASSAGPSSASQATSLAAPLAAALATSLAAAMCAPPAVEGLRRRAAARSCQIRRRRVGMGSGG